MLETQSYEIHNLTISGDAELLYRKYLYICRFSSAGDVTFNDKVIIDGTVSIDTDNTGDTTATDGIITFTPLFNQKQMAQIV